MPSDATRQDPNAPVGVDPNRASVARVYDALLGGKDNYEVDRQVVRELTAAMPDVVDLAVENRAFLIRVCRFIASQTGVLQYLDCGSGLPTAENTHQVVQRIAPESKVVYVDNDELVVAHGRALLEENESTRFIKGDIFDPRSILDDEVVQGHLDWSEPIALFQMATLHHHKGERHRPAEVMHEYIEALPSGSYVALTHILDPEGEDTEAMRNLEEAVRNGSLGGATARTRAEITELFDNLELVPPGLVELVNWWPDGPRLKPLNVAQRLFAGGVARKL
ncbi:SAM-dependent methyltransferase [Amycolatopsis sp. FDAARGOS 1241]|uniref:SAM-dependent methyltransferase n=1 Tax=Amycolatopsis sp. FDAARGOS 1241 TaxID=2778070 RepID=UPI00194EAA3F|nr:SAM-dependent methyltransferase [Amycolatopsis sp. FDAARGOS 1241]QRP42981.1 SAM-dependent methyltransferase [Amycolatopsis sp. FDAARGOS 1241]